MRAIDVQIATRGIGQIRALAQFPDRQLVRSIRDRIEMGRGDHFAEPFARQVSRLGSDRRNRTTEAMAFLALVLVRNAVADSLPARCGDIDTRACNGQPRLGLFVIPDVRQCQPAIRAMQQHTRFDQAAPAILIECECLDQRPSYRNVEQPLALCFHRRATGQVDDPVVGSTGLPLPELEALGDQPISSPRLGAGDRLTPSLEISHL